MGVRGALASLRARLAGLGIGEEDLGRVEIVLAEAMNNVAEHAYDPERGGDVRLGVLLGPTCLHCILSDRGHPLPGLRIPDGALPGTAVARENLPEGGFGWFLIRELTEHLRYDRRGNRNRLTIGFHLAQA